MGEKNPFEILKFSQDLVKILQDHPSNLRKIAEAIKRNLMIVSHPDLQKQRESDATILNLALDEISDDFKVKSLIEEFLKTKPNISIIHQLTELKRNLSDAMRKNEEKDKEIQFLRQMKILEERNRNINAIHWLIAGMFPENDDFRNMELTGFPRYFQNSFIILEHPECKKSIVFLDSDKLRICTYIPPTSDKLDITGEIEKAANKVIIAAQQQNKQNTQINLETAEGRLELVKKMLSYMGIKLSISFSMKVEFLSAQKKYLSSLNSSNRVDGAKEEAEYWLDPYKYSKRKRLIDSQKPLSLKDLEQRKMSIEKQIIRLRKINQTELAINSARELFSTLMKKDRWEGFIVGSVAENNNIFPKEIIINKNFSENLAYISPTIQIGKILLLRRRPYRISSGEFIVNIEPVGKIVKIISSRTFWASIVKNKQGLGQ